MRQHRLRRGHRWTMGQAGLCGQGRDGRSDAAQSLSNLLGVKDARHSDTARSVS